MTFLTKDFEQGGSDRGMLKLSFRFFTLMNNLSFFNPWGNLSDILLEYTFNKLFTIKVGALTPRRSKLNPFLAILLSGFAQLGGGTCLRDQEILHARQKLLSITCYPIVDFSKGFIPKYKA